jgi:type I restriction enzyme S subunit
MSEWKEYKIKDITSKITSGGTPKSSEASYYDGTIPWLNTKEINFNRITKTERCITEEGLNNSSAKWIPKGSVIVAMYGATAAKVAYSLIDLTTNQACCNLIIDEDKANSQFVYYYIQSSYEELLNLACGAAQQNLSVGVIGDFPISLPPLDEQKRIVSILSSLDDKIDLLNRENATLEAMAETLFRQWFIEEAKEDWEEGKLGDLMEVKYGKDHKKLNDGTIPVFGSGGIMRYAESALYYKESVLIPRKGSLNNVMYIDEPFWTVDTMFYTEMHRPNIAKFIFHFMKGQDLENMNVGSAVPSMTTEVLNNIPLDIPPQELFDKFEETVSVLYLKQKQNRFQIYNLSKQQDVLLPKLMSNEINI